MTRRACCLFAIFLAQAVPASAISVSWVYQNPADPFFTPQAKTTLDKAAADVGYAITTTLNSLSQDVYQGVNGATTATANWKFTYTDPTDGTTKVTLDTFNLPADGIVIYVGSRSIPGNTLGIGGPGGAGYSVGVSGIPAEWPGAAANMEAASNAGMLRGGPALGAFSETAEFDGVPATYNLSYGYSIAALTLDSDAPWHFDYNTLPGAGEHDFYSVAVHEILHGIGFGTGLTWDNHASGTNWTGPAAIALLGTGTGVLASDDSHIASGRTGHPLIDGVFQPGLQEAAMDPDITTGTRKYITDLDLAFLQDMGWDVIPEPSTALLICGAFGFLLLHRRR